MSERSTIQKAAILDTLRSASAPLSVGQVLDRSRDKVPSLAQATVYRVLKGLLDQGVIAVVQPPGEAPLYEMAGKGHHHYFRCRRCEGMFEVVGCDELLRRLAPPGFKLEDHDLFLFGLCSSCGHQD